jgi:hypothetical protein
MYDNQIWSKVQTLTLIHEFERNNKFGKTLKILMKSLIIFLYQK